MEIIDCRNNLAFLKVIYFPCPAYVLPVPKSQTEIFQVCWDYKQTIYMFAPYEF